MSETSRPIGCVIMASGLARRFGSNKLLADFGGRPLLCRALDATDTPQLACRIVVTRSAEVETLCQTLGVACLRHALPGRNDTVRLGLEALLTLQPGLAGCIFLPGDQPLLRRETVEALVCAFVADTRTQKETERAIFRLAFQAACRSISSVIAHPPFHRSPVDAPSPFGAGGLRRRRRGPAWGRSP